MTSNYQRKTKVCRGCRKRLPLEEFGVNNWRKDGHQGKCIQCMRAKQRDYINARRLAAARQGIFTSEAQRVAFEQHGARGIMIDIYDPRDRRRRGNKYGLRNVPQPPRTYSNPKIEQQLDGQDPDAGYDPEAPLVDDNLPTSWPPSPYRAYPLNVTPVDADVPHQPHNTINPQAVQPSEATHRPRLPMPVHLVRVAGVDFEDDDQGWIPLVDSQGVST